MEHITIMVATVNCNVLKNRNLMNLALHNSLGMLIVNQMLDDTPPLNVSKPYCKVINESSKGLSINRNRAIEQLDSGLAIIADDDIEYVSNFEQIIRESFTKYVDYSALTFQIRTPEGKMFKKYRSQFFTHTSVSVLRVSSISIVFKVKDILEKKCAFDSNFGIGAKYSSGEENIFLMDLLRKNTKLGCVPKVLAIHPMESSGKVFSNRHFYDKGALFKRLYGLKGFFMAIAFVVKKRSFFKIQNITFCDALKNSIRGFLYS